MKYLVEVEIGTKPGECVYNALVPALPGCFTTAMSIDELQHNLREATDLWLETAREQGDTSHLNPTGFLLRFEQVELGLEGETAGLAIIG